MRNISAKKLIALSIGTLAIALASDGGGSVYPMGVETVMPGMMPEPGATLLGAFSNFYQANELAGANGNASLPGFHLRVGAVAVKIVHNWGVRTLGGDLFSTAAQPYAYVHLDSPLGRGDKAGFSNPVFDVAGVAYARGNFHWWYALDAFTPGFSYDKNAVVNVGQHNFATGPAGAFTWLPDGGRSEISSKYLYIVNFTNPATNYRSGNQFVWEFDGMHNLNKTVAFGLNGYYYQQTTGDTLDGLSCVGGNRGRTVQAGPEIRFRFKYYVAALKYEKDFLTENGAVGNSFWLQLGVPIFHRGE